MEPLENLLDNLRREGEMPEQAALYHFSDLEPQKIDQVYDVWQDLNVDLRRHITAMLMKMAEADFSLNFNTVFRIALSDEDAEVRTMAIEGLWEDEDASLVPLLAERLREDPSAQARAAAAMSLGRFILLGEMRKILTASRDLAYEVLLLTYQDHEEHLDVRRRALESLAYTGNKTVTRLIDQAYTAPEEKMHVSAVFAMGRSADNCWAQKVRQKLFNANPEMRYEAARSCGELQLSETVKDLVELVEDVDVEVQEAALWALGQIGGNEAREILERYSQEENEALKTVACEALDELEFLHSDLDDLFAQLAEEPDW
ncbi:MAG TPA: HEAT repeat domain-containing protein [Chloroflexi bacterium]|nr:HEAT repeat domain-containing protein [Chloroflexota bacterium]